MNCKKSNCRWLLTVSIVLFAVWLGPAAAHAEMCVLDEVPAATLLLPYFEVSLDNPERNAIVTVNNATPEPTLLHVTFWTDWGVPSIDFDIFLTGYDVQVFNLYEMFSVGYVPITADDQSDPGDTISPAGDPSWDGDIQDCQNFFPFYVNPLINGNNLDRLRRGHTGQPGPGSAPEDACFGSPSPGLARGYMTFDVARRCSTEFAMEPDYFVGLNPVVMAENRVFGDVTYLVTPTGPESPKAYTLPLVHIEADPSFDADSTASAATFYGRYAAGGADHREPLGATWAVPFYDDQLITSIRAWRDSTAVADATDGYPCDTGPPVSIDHQAIQCWNDQEDVVELCASGDCFATETQSISVDTLTLPWSRGWCRLDLRTNGDSPAQSWVSALHNPSGGDGPASSLPAMSLGGACTGSPVP
ncbi:MAG: hypothetical protein MPN21_27810 [Thermoanaerobaculia bacterium]|nr:hypothetical protein [Thermoanaerobaculia bacterium]